MKRGAPRSLGLAAVPLGAVRLGAVPLGAVPLGAVLLGAVLLGAVLAGVPALASAQARVRVEGIAALVGGTVPGPGVSVLLRSDVELRARLTLAGRGGRAPSAPTPPEVRSAVLDEMIGEEIVAREAERLRAAQPSAADLAAERARLVASWGGDTLVADVVRELGADASELDALVRRRAYVTAFLRANLEGATSISDAQVERVYESGNHPFAGRPLEEARELLRMWLLQRSVQRDIRRWVQVLRGRATVRVLAPGPERP